MARISHGRYWYADLAYHRNPETNLRKPHSILIRGQLWGFASDGCGIVFSKRFADPEWREVDDDGIRNWWAVPDYEDTESVPYVPIWELKEFAGQPEYAAAGQHRPGWIFGLPIDRNLLGRCIDGLPGNQLCSVVIPASCIAVWFVMSDYRIVLASMEPLTDHWEGAPRFGWDVVEKKQLPQRKKVKSSRGNPYRPCILAG